MVATHYYLFSLLQHYLQLLLVCASNEFASYKHDTCAMNEKLVLLMPQCSI